jgi:hypothetical protein
VRTRNSARGYGALALIAAVASTLLTGCTTIGGRTKAATTATPAATPTRSTAPAAAAGGACYLLDFADITATLGVRFDVAAASKHDKTSACVVQQAGASRPDLVLTATPTNADGAIFKSDVTPKGGIVVKNLGAAGYQRTLPATAGAGPGAEVGWLAGNGRLLTLRFTNAIDADPAAGGTVLPKLVALAQKIDESSI